MGAVGKAAAVVEAISLSQNCLNFGVIFTTVSSPQP